jgi:multidrug resistance efflux pump
MKYLLPILTILTQLQAMPLIERGWLESSHSTEYRTTLSGRIIELLDHGQRVHQGDIISVQDTSSTLESIENIKGQLLELKSDLSNAQSDAEIKQNQLEEEHRMNEANLSLAQAKLSEANDKPDPRELKLNTIDLELSMIDLKTANLDLDRQKRMVEKGFGSSRSLDSYQIRVKSREQALKIQEAKRQNLLEGSNQELLIELKTDVEKWEGLVRRHQNRMAMTMTSLNLVVERINKEITEKERELNHHQELLTRSQIVAKEDGLLLFFMKRDWSAAGALKPINVGDMISGSDKLARIIDPSSVKVTAPIHESNLQRVCVDQKARVTFPALPNVVAEGKVTTVSMVARDLSEILPQGYLDRSHGQSYFKVVIELSEQNPLYKPGMTASITFLDKETP